MNHIELTQGEIKINLTEYSKGKLTFKELGIENDYSLEGGHLRFVLDLSKKGEANYFQVPTLEFTYSDNVPETHWQVEFNGEIVLDKNDHFGHSTILLLNRKKLEDLQQHHENILVLHAELPKEVSLITEKCTLNFLK